MLTVLYMCSKVFVLCFVTFDGLGGCVGHFFQHLECGVGGVITVFCVVGMTNCWH